MCSLIRLGMNIFSFAIAHTCINVEFKFTYQPDVTVLELLTRQMCNIS